MIEPTETEAKDTLDKYADILKKILREFTDNPEIVKSSPHTNPGRLDEVMAARRPNLRWHPR